MPGTAELRRHLSRFLKRVRAGERILVTDRGEPIAEVVPYQRGGGGAVSTRVAYLAGRGVLSVPKAAFTGQARLVKPAPGGSPTPAADALARDREGLP